MEKEIIRFEAANLPIKICNTVMSQHGIYRDMHFHHAIEVVEVKQGVLNCHINHEIITLRENDIIFINSNTGHKLLLNDAVVSYIQINPMLFVGTEKGDSFSELYRFISYTKAKPYLLLNADTEASEIIGKIYARYHENDKASQLYLKAYIYELFAFLCSRDFIMPTIMPTEHFDKIKPIVNFIDENYFRNITLDEIGDVVGYNKYAVCRYFKSATGGTVFDYINFLRLHLAVEKLKDKNASILDVATDSGFSSSTYFNRVFKDVIGCSPSVYRKGLDENLQTDEF